MDALRSLDVLVYCNLSTAVAVIGKELEEMW